MSSENITSNSFCDNKKRRNFNKPQEKNKFVSNSLLRSTQSSRSTEFDESINCSNYSSHRNADVPITRHVRNSPNYKFKPVSRSSSKSSLNSDLEGNSNSQVVFNKLKRPSRFHKNTLEPITIDDLNYGFEKLTTESSGAHVPELSGSSTLNFNSSDKLNIRRTKHKNFTIKKTERYEKLSIYYLDYLCSLDNYSFTKRLSHSIHEFKDLFHSPLQLDHIETLFKFISKLCSIELELTKKTFLDIILGSSEFLSCVKTFILRVVELSRTECRLNENIKMSISFFLNVLDYIPSQQLSNYKLLVNTISEISNKCKIHADFILMLDKCNDILSKKIKINQEDIITYKSLCVFPLYQEIFHESDLNITNIINGPYESVSQYIDVQFKLLKEDYLCGLRSGINQYLEEIKTKNRRINHDIFVYRNVKYHGLSKDDNPFKNMIFEFSLGHFLLDRINKENSKRLIHGSLLFFSADNFRTLFMGVLDDRKKQDDELRIFVVFFGKSIKVNRKTEYTMIESRNFFEPYYQVCTALKEIHPQLFPMSKYIVFADTEPRPPKYLKPNSQFEIAGYEVPISRPDSWTDIPNTGLNASQSVALHAALSREFVIIQGPPGTGKTYLGIKIINILLDNKGVWSDGKTPIFVACYRNDAVDQILESLASDEVEKPRKVVRLGNRSSSDILKECTLRNTVSDRRDPIVFGELLHLKDELKEIKNKINLFENIKEFVIEKEGILDFKVFSKILTTHQRQYFSSSNAYENWLLEDDECDELFFEEGNEVIQKRLNEKQSKRKKQLVSSFIYLSIDDLINELSDLAQNIVYLESLSGQKDDNIKEISESIVQYNIKANILIKVIQRIYFYETDAKIEKLKSADLSALNIRERWTLYNHWAEEFVKTSQHQIDSLIDSHDQKVLNLRYKRDQNDGENLRYFNVDVVGATTTGAARLSKLLSVIKPKIVIIEEAAEILEAHTVTSLSEHCEHLILIGDHQQLKPSPASHAASVNYHMDISLFERMILNGMESFSLSEQHRMRPEIAALVSPYFYPDLTNHPSVESYPDVIGFKNNLFFLDHEMTEDQLLNNDSHQNTYEANLVMQLTNYILKQGYKESQVTVLTPYVAQLLLLKSMKGNYPFLKNVTFEVVDNFQGDENDIIVLSLVRSNSSTIGFLSKNNRVCVALSRAKIGFFMVGNMGTLCKNSHVWKEIKKVLSEKSSIDKYLPLKCKTHKKITRVNIPEDFYPLKNGGCTDECKLELPCGHICNYMCHPFDTDHKKKFLCNKPCTRKRNCDIHDCTAECGEECPECDIKLPQLLECGHSGFRLCGGEVLNCESPCSALLVCGHACPKKCHIDDKDYVDHSTIVCKAICERPNQNCPFKHKCPKICSEECEECEVDTVVELDCGHIMKGICCKISDKLCEIQVDRTLICGHTVTANCSVEESKLICTELIKIVLDCGHEVEKNCSTNKNDINCNILVEKLLPCLHKKEEFCYIPVENIVCNKSVNKMLKCGHVFQNALCSSSVGDLICDNKVLKTLNCGHENEVNCGEEYPLCSKSTVIVDKNCGHTKIIPCSEVYKPSAGTCSAELHKCEKPCNETLSCHHSCRGTCGSCMKGHIHVVCNEVCGADLICGHKCTMKCWVDLHSCKSSCMNSCKHKKCNRLCGDICEKCTEPCEWVCNHYKCTKKCWEVCNRPQCQESCTLNLLCGHPCLGYCGEPCPPICPICSPEEKIDLTDRYILLEDCDHSIPLSVLKSMMEKAVGILRCPDCSGPIIKTNYIRVWTKSFFLKYPKVKNTSSDLYNNKRLIIRDFQKNFRTLNDVLKSKYKGCKSLSALLINLLQRTVPIMQNKETRETKLGLKTLLFICFYVTEALKITNFDCAQNHIEILLTKVNVLASYLLERAKNKISPREMEQFYDELIRLKCMVDLIVLKEEDSLFNGSNVQKFDEVTNAIVMPKQFGIENQISSKNLLFKLKKELKSNHELICSNSYNSDKILEFFRKYYPIYYHIDNWQKCKNNHSYFSRGNTDFLCPVCSDEKMSGIFFT